MTESHSHVRSIWVAVIVASSFSVFAAPFPALVDLGSNFYFSLRVVGSITTDTTSTFATFAFWNTNVRVSVVAL